MARQPWKWDIVVSHFLLGTFKSLQVAMGSILSIMTLTRSLVLLDPSTYSSLLQYPSTHNSQLTSTLTSCKHLLQSLSPAIIMLQTNKLKKICPCWKFCYDCNHPLSPLQTSPPLETSWMLWCSHLIHCHFRSNWLGEQWAKQIWWRGRNWHFLEGA